MLLALATARYELLKKGRSRLEALGPRDIWEYKAFVAESLVRIQQG